jgi:16S rRNA (cytidine1402-2'-O)-methyltransferase
LSTLYIVATPIGNLQDITLRALDTLKNAALLACEDTRVSLKLLNHFGIKQKLISVRAQNEREGAAKVLDALKNGGDVAYISDAGTPGLSDPGAALTRIVSGAGFPVIPIPGPSAFSAIVSAGGTLDKSILFEGFLSPKGSRRKRRVEELLATGFAFVLYESPFRIKKLLDDLVTLAPRRYACLGREMTKIHEEYIRGSIKDILTELDARGGEHGDKKSLQGEYTLLVSGFDESDWKR